MKIKYHNPKLCKSEYFSHKINRLLGLVDQEEFINALAEWGKSDFIELIELHYWVDVLNRIDCILEDFLSKWNSLTIISDKKTELLGNYDVDNYYHDLNQVKVCLKFTSLLLFNSIEKIIYNSMNNIVILFKAYDDDLAFLAIEVTMALASSPLYHRCHLDWSSHSTILEKNAEYLNPLFVIIEAARNIKEDSYDSFEQFVNNPYILNDPNVYIYLDDNFSNINQSMSTKDIFRTQNSIKSVLNSEEDNRSNFDVVNDSKYLIPDSSRLFFLWCLRFHRWKISHNYDLIYKAFLVNYQCLAILLSSYSDTYALANYLQSKSELLKDFIYILQSSNIHDVTKSLQSKSPNHIRLSIRLAVCQCLSSIIGNEDSLEAGIFGKLTSLQYSLGLSRGQYMGLIPTLLRSIGSYIVSIFPTESLANNFDDLVISEEIFLWIEGFFLLILSICQYFEPGQYLPENGLLSTILLIFSKLHLSPNLSSNPELVTLWTFIESIVIMVADTCMTISQVCISFIRQDGIETSMNLLLTKLHQKNLSETNDSQMKSSSSSIHSQLIDLGANKIVLQHLLSLLNILFERGLQENLEYRINTTYKSTIFLNILKILYKYSNLETFYLIDIADSLITDMINLDPSTPSMSNFLIQSDVISLVLSQYQKQNHDNIYITDSFLIDRANLLYGLALTSEGITLLQNINPYPQLLSIISNPKYNFANTNILNTDVIHSISVSLEETIRHYPVMLDQVLDSVIDESRLLISYGKVYLLSNKFNIVEYIHFLYKVTSILSIIHTLLSRESIIESFINKDGLDLLFSFTIFPYYNDIYLLNYLATSTVTSLQYLGHKETINMLTSCIQKLFQYKATICNNYFMDCIYFQLYLLCNDISLFTQNDSNLDMRSNRIVEFDFSDWRETENKYENVLNNSETIQNFIKNDKSLKIHELQYNKSTIYLLRNFLRISYFLSILFPINKYNVLKFGETSIANLETIIVQPDMYNLLDLITNSIFVPIQLEISKYIEDMFLSFKYKGSDRFIYKLLVVSEIGLWVREGVDELSSRLFDIPKGSVLQATCRVVSNGKVIKYRISEGWINSCKKSSSFEPLVELLEVFENPDYVDSYEDTTKLSELTYEDIDDRYLCDITTSRATYSAFGHTGLHIRTMLGSVSKVIVSTLSNLHRSTKKPSVVSNEYINKYILLLANCIKELLNNLSQLSPLVSTTNEIPSVITIEQANITFTYLSIITVELTSEVLFVSKPNNNSDTNILLLMHLSSCSMNEITIIDKILRLCMISIVLNVDDFSNNAHQEFLLLDIKDKYLCYLQNRIRLVLNNNINQHEFLNKLLNFITTTTTTFERTLMKISADDTYCKPGYDSYAFRKNLAVKISTYFIYYIIKDKFKFSRNPIFIMKSLFETLLLAIKCLQEVKTLPNVFNRSWLSLDRLSSVKKEIEARRATPAIRYPSYLSTDVHSPVYSYTGDDPLDPMEQWFTYESEFPRRDENSRINDLNEIAEANTNLSINQSSHTQSSNINVNSVVNGNEAYVANPFETTLFSNAIEPSKEATLIETKKSDDSLFIPNLENVLVNTDHADIGNNLDFLFKQIPLVTLYLIEEGCQSSKDMLYFLSNEQLEEQVQYSRDMFNIYLLTNILLCLDRRSLSKFNLKVSVICWIVKRIVRTISNALSEKICSKDLDRSLFGLLHVLLTLCYGYSFVITSSASTNSINHSKSLPEQVIFVVLLLSNDGRYKTVISSLIQYLTFYISHLNSNDNLILPEWIPTALLFLDIFVQPIHINRSTFTDFFDRLYKDDNSNISIQLDSDNFSDSLEVDVIITLEFKSFVDKNIIERNNDNSLDRVTTNPFIEIYMSSTDLELSIHIIDSLLNLYPKLDKSSQVLLITLSDSICQYLVHLLQHDVCIKLVKQEMLMKLLLINPFPSYSSIVFTIFQRILENHEILTQSFHNSMKTIFMKMEKSKLSGYSATLSKYSKVYLSTFVESTYPLLIRNYKIFYNCLYDSFEIKCENDNAYIVQKTDKIKNICGHSCSKSDNFCSVCGIKILLEKSNDQLELSDFVDTKLTAMNETSSGKRTVDNVDSIHKRRKLSEDSYINVDNTTSTNIISLNDIVNQLIASIISMSTISASQPLSCSITDLLYILSGLVISIPGVATLIHKYSLSGVDCTLIHAITKVVLNNNKSYFIHFVIHQILLSNIGIANNDNTGDSLIDKKVLGTNVKDAGCYLIAALISRPGEGRKKTINDLLDVIKLYPNVYKFDSKDSVNALLIYIETINNLLSPPLRWKLKEMFTIPSLEVLYLFTKFNLHVYLSNVLSMLSMDSPLSLEVLINAMALIDTIVRKGGDFVTKVSYHDKSDQKKEMMSSLNNQNSSMNTNTNDILVIPGISSQLEDMMSPNLTHQSSLPPAEVESDSSDDYDSDSNDDRSGRDSQIDANSVIGDDVEDGEEEEDGDDVEEDGDDVEDESEGGDNDDDHNHDGYSRHSPMFYNCNQSEGEDENIDEDDDDGMDGDEENVEDEMNDLIDHEDEDVDDDEDDQEDEDDIVEIDMDVDNMDVLDPEQIDRVLQGDIDQNDDFDHEEDNDEENEDHGDEDNDMDEEEDQDDEDIPPLDQSYDDFNTEIAPIESEHVQSVVPEELEDFNHGVWSSISVQQPSFPSNADNEADNDSNSNIDDSNSNPSVEPRIDPRSFMDTEPNAAARRRMLAFANLPNVEFNFLGSGENSTMRLQVHLDQNNPMDIFEQVIGRTLTRMTGQVNSRGNRIVIGSTGMSRMMNSSTPTSTSRRRTSSRRQSTSEYNRQSNNESDVMTAEDYCDPDVVNMFDSFHNSNPGDANIFISRSSNSHRARVTADNTHNLGDNYTGTSLIYDSRVNAHLIQDLSIRPIVNPLISIIDYMRTLRTNHLNRIASINGTVRISSVNQNQTVLPILQTNQSSIMQNINLQATISNYATLSPIPRPNNRISFDVILASILDHSSNAISNNIRSFVREIRQHPNSNRSSLGTIISERRWGVDVGEILGSTNRGNSLGIIVSSFFNKSKKSRVTEKVKEVNSSNEKSKIISWEDVFGPSSTNLYSDNIESCLTEPIETHNSNEAEIANENFIEESKFEGVLQESKEDDIPKNRISADVFDEYVISPQQTNTVAEDSTFPEIDETISKQVSSSNEFLSTAGESSAEMEISDSTSTEVTDSRSLVNEVINSNTVDNRIDSNTIDEGIDLTNTINEKIVESSGNLEESTTVTNLTAQPATIQETTVNVGSIACPPGIDLSVWVALPLDMQLEMASNYGMDTTALIESEIQASNVDREVLLSLPSELRQEILVEESNERKRRMSLDLTNESNSSAITIQPSSQSVVVTSSSSNTSTNQSTLMSYENIDFVNSLTFDLRQEILSTAESTFLQSLTSEMQAEARRLRNSASSYMNSTGHQPVINTSSNDVPNNQPLNTLVDHFSSGRYSSSAGLSASTSNNFINFIDSLFHQSEESARNNNSSIDTSRNRPNNTNVSSTIKVKPDDESNTFIILQADKSIELFYYSETSSNSTESNESNIYPLSKLFLSTPINIFIKVYKCILSLSNKSKLPRQLTKVLSTLCIFKEVRVVVLKGLFYGLLQDSKNLINSISNYKYMNDMVVISSISNDSSLQLHLSHPLTIRRTLHTISYLIRKTNRKVWNEIITAPINSSDIWYFGSLINLLHPVPLDESKDEINASPNLVQSNIDLVLHLIEEIVAPLSRVSVVQANRLVEYNNNKIEVAKIKNELVLGDITSNPVSKDEEDDRNPTKRIRFSSDADINVNNIVSSNMSVSNDENKTPTKSKENELTQFNITTNDGSSNIPLPFPVLSDVNTYVLSIFASSEYSIGQHRKRLLKILRVISLYDGNWKKFLNQLSNVGNKLVSNILLQLNSLYNNLINNQFPINSKKEKHFHYIYTNNYDPNQLQQRLLYTIETMTLLRSRSSVSASDESEIVSSFIKEIQFNNLWELLSKCLDYIRDVEGLVYDEEDSKDLTNEGNASTTITTSIPSTPNRPNRTNSRSNNTPSRNNRNDRLQHVEDNRPLSSLSSLTMRFIPLIECYLLVCSIILIRKTNNSSANSTSNSITNDVTLPGQRFRQHSNFDIHIDLVTHSNVYNQLLTFIERNSVLLNIILKSSIQLLELSFSPLIYIPKYRHFLSFDIKRLYFRMKLKKLKVLSSRQSSHSHNNYLSIKVRRKDIFEDSFRSLRYKTADEMKRKLHVEFTNEEGMDAGGLTREWFSVIAKEIFNVNYCLFNSVNDNDITYQPSPSSYINPDHLSYYKFIGRVIGKSIFDNHLFDAHFTRSFYKHMLGLPVTLSDLEAIEPDYYKSLKQILETPLDLLGLDLTFVAETNNFGKTEVVELIPGGSEKPVTDDNKGEYVRLLANHRMTTAIRKQIDAFLDGFHELIPADLISIFDAQELELLISGLPEIDLDDLRTHTEYSGYKVNDIQIQYFWNVLRSFSKEEKALFLQFVTGTSKVPLEGFRALRGSDGIRLFNIQKAFGKHLLPSAHTCFNQLDLPEYESEEETKEKLLIAIKEGSEGFGFA